MTNEEYIELTRKNLFDNAILNAIDNAPAKERPKVNGKICHGFIMSQCINAQDVIRY